MLTHTTGRVTPYYRCHYGPGAPGCGRSSISAEPLERDITAALFAYVDTADLAKLAQAKPGDPAGDISRELDEIEAEARETSDLAARGEIRPADFARYSATVDGRQRALRARLARLSGNDTLTPYAGRPGALAAVWDRLSMAQRRALILAALGRLVVEPATRGGHYDFARVRAAVPHIAG